MIHKYTNSLSEVRAKAEVSIENLGLLTSLTPMTLRDMESGKQKPSLRVVAMYHLLFRASYKELFADLCADVQTQLIERSENLIAMLESSQSLKSKQRIQGIYSIVNMLNCGYDD